MNLQRFASIVKKEFIQIRRDKASFIIALMMPLMMMLLFGYVVTTELDNIPMAVLDQSHTAESRDLVKAYENTNYFNVKENINSMDKLDLDMKKGIIHAALVIPPDYAEKLNTKNSPNILLYIDGSDPTTAKTAFSSGVMAGQSYGLKKYIINTTSLGITINTKVLYNPELRNQNFTIPGLIGLIMQNITILLTAFTLVREKERGTIEQLIVSPVKSTELILGKLLPYILIGYFDFLYALAFGLLWFKVPIHGSIGLLLFLGAGFVICALAIGVLISTIAKSQLQAMQLTLLTLLPSVLLSGFIFPVEAMPQVVRYFSFLVPLTYFLNILRGIVLKGSGIELLLNDILMLVLLGIFLLFISIVRFRKKLD